MFCMDMVTRVYVFRQIFFKDYLLVSRYDMKTGIVSKFDDFSSLYLKMKSIKLMQDL